MHRPGLAFIGWGTALLLAYWSARLAALAAFPPFMDEVLHLQVTEQMARLSPLVSADLGRLFTVWSFALFYPLGSDPIWVARLVTLLAALPGFAAVIALGRTLGGRPSGLLAGLLVLFSAYHHFFERLALADPISSALALVALAFAARLSRRADWRDAALCGLALFAAFGAKTNALPYFAIPVIAALTLRPPGAGWRRRAIWAGVALAVGLGLSTALVAALALFGYDYVLNSFAFVATNTWTFDAVPAAPLLDAGRILGNTARTLDMLNVYAGPAMIAAGALGVAALARRRRGFLPLAFLLPVAVLWFSRPQETRYWAAPVATLWLAAVVAAAPLLRHRRARLTAVALAGIWALTYGLPFMLDAAQPHTLAGRLPFADFSQYAASDAGGFGLAETRDALLERQPRAVIGVLSNCNGLRYLAWRRLPVECPPMRPDGQDIAALTRLMVERRAPGVYVVLEESPYAPPDAPGERLLTIARPGGQASLAIYDLAP